MSPPQRIHLMAELWPKACATQGWDRSDRELRLRVFSEAVGRPLESANDINSTTDFDALKRHLRTLADSLAGAMDSAEAGEARRTMHHVRQLLAELEELHPEPGVYVQTLLRGIHRGRRVEIGGVEELGTRTRIVGGRELISELEQFRRTLNARIHGKNGLAAQAAQPSEALQPSEEVF